MKTFVACLLALLISVNVLASENKDIAYNRKNGFNSVNPIVASQFSFQPQLDGTTSQQEVELSTKLGICLLIILAYTLYWLRNSDPAK